MVNHSSDIIQLYYVTNMSNDNIVSSNQLLHTQRKQELKTKFQHAAREFARICTKSNHIIPKEQQVSIDLGNKMIFNYMSKQLLQLPLTSKSASYIYEVGTKERIFGFDTTVKYFTRQEQDDHTRKPNMDETGEWRLYNNDGSIYDTTDVLNSGGKIMYAMSLDCKLITALEILAEDGIEYCCWHSSLLAAGAGLCFGSLIVENGKIVYISNHSGHYNPSAENLYNIIIKLNGLFTDNAVLRVYYKSFDKNGVFRTNKKQTKVLSEKYYCSVKEFMERIEKGLSIVPEEDKVAMPSEYFEKIREYNEWYKNVILYKPVSVINGNVVMAIEHSIRKLIGANFGNKPILGKDDDNLGVTVCFRNVRDALKFHSIILETFKCENGIVISYLHNFNHIVYVLKKFMYEFVERVLKIKLTNLDL